MLGLGYGDAGRRASRASWCFAARWTFFPFTNRRRVQRPHHRTRKHKHTAMSDIAYEDAGRDAARGAGRVE